MCNLNILVKNNKEIENNNLLNFFNSANFNSFINNSDAEGFYFNHNNLLITSEKKLNLFDYKNNIDLSNFIIGHQRFITSGNDSFNTQPFKKNSFVLAHNGVLNSYVKSENNNSDSLNLFEDFIKRFEKHFKKNRENAIKKALRECLNNISGSYSIALFDILTNNLYYVKNDMTRINFYINKNKSLLYITTEKQNYNFLNVYEEGFKELNIKDFLIYKVNFSKKNKIVVCSIGKIKKNKVVSVAYFPKYNFNLNDFDTNKKDLTKEFKKDLLKDITKKELNDFKASWSIGKNLKELKCSDCDEMTFNNCGSINAIMCDNCLKEEMLIQNQEMKDYNSSFKEYC
jgi:predicted glutamine amidotransferase